MICSDRSRRRTSCFTVDIAVVIFDDIFFPPVRISPANFLDLCELSQSVYGTGWTKLYSEKMKSGRRGKI